MYKLIIHLRLVRVSLLSIFSLLFMTTLTKAQDILAGLTSNGGTEGRGTAFSIKTNGTNFSIIKAIIAI